MNVLDSSFELLFTNILVNLLQFYSTIDVCNV